MRNKKTNSNVFIVGSPRSGTTMLGDILDLHPKIGRWYEPIFVLDRYFHNAPNDSRTAADATKQVKEYIVSAFDHYQARRECEIVVDKSPGNSLKVPFLLKIFPEAKFIHVLRDGRDTTLSIHREWRTREKILERGTNFLQGMRVIKNFLDRQQFFEHKLAALNFEVGSLSNIFKGRSHMLYRLRRWNGRIGWGPQFEGWEAVIDKVSTLEFNALQWVKCVEAIIAAGQNLEEGRFLEIRYEEFLKQPQETLERIFDFLEVPFPEDFMSCLPALKASNYGKWKVAFSGEEKALIGPILNPLLIQLGYADSGSWYKCQTNE